MPYHFLGPGLNRLLVKNADLGDQQCHACRQLLDTHMMLTQCSKHVAAVMRCAPCCLTADDDAHTSAYLPQALCKLRARILDLGAATQTAQCEQHARAHHSTAQHHTS
jgi:hypothetical protein